MLQSAQACFCFHEVNSGSDSWPALWKHPVTPRHNIANPWLLLAKCNFQAQAQAVGFLAFHGVAEWSDGSNWTFDPMPELYKSIRKVAHRVALAFSCLLAHSVSCGLITSQPPLQKTSAPSLSLLLFLNSSILLFLLLPHNELAHVSIVIQTVIFCAKLSTK